MTLSFVMHTYFKGNNEIPLSGVLVIGEDASFNNPISDGTFCFDISLDSDIFKEGLEFFALSLQSDDDCVCLGRDVALAQVQANGGMKIMNAVMLLLTYVHAVVEVNIMSDAHLQVNESDGFIEICVQADHPSQTVFEVMLTTMDGTAMGESFTYFMLSNLIMPLAGEDYVAVNKSVFLYPGFGTIQCVHIPILNDECLEDDIESFGVFISASDDCVVIGATSEVEVYIRDDDGKCIK